jgi:hypothetical protein
MTPLFFKGESVHIAKVDHSILRVNDSVFCRINSGLQIHKLSNIDEENQRYEISNNHGHINGKVGPQAIFGLAVQVEDRILVSEKELQKRAEEENNKVKK